MGALFPVGEPLLPVGEALFSVGEGLIPVGEALFSYKSYVHTRSYGDA